MYSTANETLRAFGAVRFDPHPFEHRGGRRRQQQTPAGVSASVAVFPPRRRRRDGIAEDEFLPVGAHARGHAGGHHDHRHGFIFEPPRPRSVGVSDIFSRRITRRGPCRNEAGGRTGRAGVRRVPGHAQGMPVAHDPGEEGDGRAKREMDGAETEAGWTEETQGWRRRSRL